MSTKHPYQSFDEQLREQFDQFLPDMPEGVWEGMESNLDAMNSDLQFDQGIREGMDQLQINPPQGVFEAIQAQLPGSAGIGTSIGLVGKWVAGSILAGGIVTATWLGLNHSNEPALPSEGIQTVQPAADPAEEKTNTTADIHSSQTPIPAADENGFSNKQLNTANPRLPGGSSQGYTGSNVPGARGNDNTPVTVNSQDRVTPSPTTPATPPKQTNPPMEDPAPVFCFSAKDSNLCMNQPYAFFLKNADNCKYDIWIDNMPYERNISGDKGVVIVMDRTGMRTVEVNVRRGEGSWRKTQTLHVAELPVVNVMRVDQGNGKYAFESGCVNHTVSWYVDGVYHSKGSSTQCQFYDPIPKDHQMLAIAKSAKGCSDSSFLEFRNNVTFTTKPLVAPNSFSPNGDGVNDNYAVEIEGATTYSIRIYNLNNELVFESNDPKAVWDGKDKFRGNMVHPGQYRCIIEYSLAGGPKKKLDHMVGLFVKEN